MNKRRARITIRKRRREAGQRKQSRQSVDEEKQASDVNIGSSKTSPLFLSFPFFILSSFRSGLLFSSSSPDGRRRRRHRHRRPLSLAKHYIRTDRARARKRTRTAAMLPACNCLDRVRLKCDFGAPDGPPPPVKRPALGLSLPDKHRAAVLFFDIVSKRRTESPGAYLKYTTPRARFTRLSFPSRARNFTILGNSLMSRRAGQQQRIASARKMSRAHTHSSSPFSRRWCRLASGRPLASIDGEVKNKTEETGSPGESERAREVLVGIYTSRPTDASRQVSEPKPLFTS